MIKEKNQFNKDCKIVYILKITFHFIYFQTTEKKLYACEYFKKSQWLAVKIFCTDIFINFINKTCKTLLLTGSLTKSKKVLVCKTGNSVVKEKNCFYRQLLST